MFAAVAPVRGCVGGCDPRCEPVPLTREAAADGPKRRGKARCSVRDRRSASFLGFSISNDGKRAVHSLQKPSTNSRRRSWDLTAGTRGIPPAAVIEDSSYLIGWRGYFGFCQTPRVLEPGSVDSPKIRGKKTTSGVKDALVSLAAVGRERANRFKELRSRACPKSMPPVAAGSTDGVLAHVRTPGGPKNKHLCANHYFALTRSSRSNVSTKLNPVEPAVVRTVGRGGGGVGIARCPPIPIKGVIRKSGVRSSFPKSQNKPARPRSRRGLWSEDFGPPGERANIFLTPRPHRLSADRQGEGVGCAGG